jgi:integrase
MKGCELMENVIYHSFGAPREVYVTSVKRNAPQKDIEKVNLIPEAVTNHADRFEEHDAEPFKNIEDISRIAKYLTDSHRYRDNMLFIVGINFGLRISDLLSLRFSDVINEDLTFKTSFPILEKKTSTTRKKKKNRYVTINEAVMEAISLYLENNRSRLNDFMFKSESNRGSNQDSPMTRKSADRILKNIKEELHFPMRIATHSMRKTFGYHQMAMSGHDPRKLLLLQKMFGHSTSAQTLEYIGITKDEIGEAYATLNLGKKENYKIIAEIC